LAPSSLDLEPPEKPGRFSSYADVIGDVDLWLGRSNIAAGAIDWTAAPSNLTNYTSSVATF